MTQSSQPKVLGPVDTAFLYVESSKTPMNIGALTLLEGKISFDSLTRLVDARIHQAPLYQKRLVQAPLSLGPYMWVFDPDFHIGNHVFRVAVDPPGTDEHLRELVGHLVSSTLDRTKPLWEIYMIEGLEGNRTAIFFKVHHCMVDGLSAVELFTLLFDLTPDIPPLPPKPLYDPPYLQKTPDLLVDSTRRDISHKFNILQKLAHDALHVGSVLADKELRRRALIGIANLVNDNLRPIKKLAINGSNSGKMTLAWASFSLAEVRAIRSNQRASVNDVMLTVLAGALDRYLEQRGENPDRDFVRVLVPVNMRVETEKNTFGNRISVLPIDIPFGISDPLERLSRTAEYTQIMKESSLSIGLDIVLTLPALAPAIAQPLIWGVAPLAFSFLAHTWCTNVAGPQIPLYMLGHQLLNTFGYFPLNPSMGLACVITSYNQHISMTLVADTAIIPDADKLRDLLKSSFVNLRQAAKVQPIEPIAIEHRRSDPPPSSPPAPQSQPETPATNTASNGASAVETASTPADDPVVESTANGTDKTVVPVDVPAEPVTMMEETAANEVITEDAAKLHEASDPAPVSSIPTKLKLFSEEWAQAYRTAINNNQNYHKASTKWTAGSLAFVMQADARNGFPQPTAVLLDLYKGECRSAHNLSAYEARRDAAFVIEGDYKNWMVALSGQTPPLMMLMTRKLKLTKGSLTKLMPFTQSAQELITSAQAIP